MDHAGVSMVLMLTSGGLKAVCMQDTTDVLIGGLCSSLHKGIRLHYILCMEREQLHGHTHR